MRGCGPANGVSSPSQRRSPHPAGLLTKVPDMRSRLLLLLLLVLPLPVALFAASETPAPRVLVVQSYDAGYIWCGQINRGIDEALKGSGAAIDVVYMDAKRNQDPAHLRTVAEEILERIERTRPRVVIAVDDAAQQYLAAPSLKGRDWPQVIFCGVNAPLAKYGYPAANVSGVRERWHYRDGFALLRRIVPEVRRVAFLVEDSESGGYVLDDLLEEQRRGPAMGIKLVMAEKVRTFQQWQLLVRKAQQSADALALGLYNALIDETTGQVTPPDKVMAWTNSVNKKPTLGFSDIAKPHGLLCGVLEAGHEQGHLAGGMARQVLGGAPAGELPVRVNTKGVVFVNLRTAKRLGAHVPFSIIEAAAEVIK